MKMHLFSICMLILIFTSKLFAQKDVEIDYKVYAQVADLSKEEVKSLKTADEIYYSDDVNRHKKALPVYLGVLRDTLDYDPLLWRVAMCYLYSEQKPKAINYILRCNEGFNPLYYFYLAKAYHFDNQFEKAKRNYAFFAENADAEQQKLLFKTFNVKAKDYDFAQVMAELMTACDVALEEVDDTIQLHFENIKIANSSRNEIYPVFLNKERTLLFSSDKITNPKLTESNFVIYEAVYDSMMSVVSFPKVSPRYPKDDTDNMIPLPYYEFGDGVLYQSMEEGGIMMARRKGKKLIGEELPKLNSSAQENNACYIDDGVLVFSSDRDHKNGETDMYLSVKSSIGKWGKATNLGTSINSEANDEVVGFYDGELYFSSDRKGGLGAYDVYKVAYFGENSWGEVQNMGYPINTADNDMGYLPVDDKYAFYFGVRPDGLGGTDIYKVTQGEWLLKDTTVIDTVIVDSVVLDIMTPDSLLLLPDSMALVADSLIVSLDSMAQVVDSLIINPDSMSVVTDTSSFMVSDKELDVIDAPIDTLISQPE